MNIATQHEYTPNTKSLFFLRRPSVAGERKKNKYRLRNPQADFEEKKYEGRQQANYLFSSNNTIIITFVIELVFV